ncbi:MAG: FtsX-like permease family protein, partial [Anaerolineae bacterium]
MASLLFVLRRARRHWQILLTLCLGVVLATALLASGPLLAETVVEMGLHLTFQSSGVPEANLRLAATAAVDEAGARPSTQRYEICFRPSWANDAEIRDLLQAELGKHMDRTIRSAQSPWAFPWLEGEPAADQRLNLRAYEGLKDHLEYVAGGWPAEAAGESGVVPVIVGEAMARALVLRLGQRLPLSLEPDSPEPDAWLEVAGIARPKDPLDAYWFGGYSPLTSQNAPAWSAQYSAIVPEDAFWPTVAALFPGDGASLAWHVLLRHDAFSALDIEPFQAQLAGLDAELDSLRPSVTLETGVPDILARFQVQMASIRVPLYILIAEVMLLALYFVSMVAALSMRQVEREFAILRSRGSSAWQVARIQLIEALAIGAVAFVSGPWLGAGLVRALAWIGPLADLQQVNVRLTPGPGAWLASGVGALACLASLLLPLRPALRRSIVIHQQMAARSSRAPWWQRFYLDVFALVAGLILLWRLRLYGEMVSGGPGGVRLDWLLLLAPVVLLLGTATILLRLFPLLLRTVAALAARGPGLEGALALWQASREPAHVTRLVLLLALAVALGTLSLGLNITLDQSEYDRATYLAGNDLRLVSEGAVPLVDLQTAPGVVRLSATWRGQGSVDLGEEEKNPGFEILAIEPDSFASVTTSRRDFADQKMDELLDQLAVAAGQNPSLLPLPGRPAGFGLWLWGLSRDKM